MQQGLSPFTKVKPGMAWKGNIKTRETVLRKFLVCLAVCPEATFALHFGKEKTLLHIVYTV